MKRMAQMLERRTYQTDNGFRLEPGYYKENDFGIRIEDVAVIVPVQTKVDAESVAEQAKSFMTTVFNLKFDISRVDSD